LADVLPQEGVSLRMAENQVVVIVDTQETARVFEDFLYETV
jgi:hypothetical protein